MLYGGGNKITRYYIEQSKMQNEYDDPQVLANFIKNKGFSKDRQFNSNPANLLRLIEYVEELPPSLQSLNSLENLLKFYGFPLFICIRPLYEKLQRVKDFEGEEKIKDIASFIKQYLGEMKFEELKFFFYLGASKIKYQMRERSKPEKQFMEYVKKLSDHLTKLRQGVDKMTSRSIKIEIDAILAAGIERKLNTIELQYENYFKKAAADIYSKNKAKIEEENDHDEPINKGIQLKPEYIAEDKHVPLCCRQFFFEQEIIREPENLVLEYKHYQFPFDDKRISILKKTMCAFLNTNGGIIFVGIHEDNNTKKRTVKGMYLSDSDQEDFLREIRKIAQTIQPSIIGNKNYQVKFVPIKNFQHKQYISGKFLAKIIVNFGLRDEIYSYHHDDEDCFSFRTQNQVIHRKGREVLNIYRERIKNPLPEPNPIHPGPCKEPELGRRIYYHQKQKKKESQKKKEKMKYKQKEAMDYLIIGLKQAELEGEIQRKKLLKKCMIVNSQSKGDHCFLKITDPDQKENLEIFLNELEEKGIQVEQIQRGIKIMAKGYEVEVVEDALKSIKVVYDKVDQSTFKFKSADVSIKAYLIIHEYQFNEEFVAV